MARHFMVIVTEGPDDDRRDSIVLAEPLDRVSETRAAFALKSVGYVASARWGTDLHGNPRDPRCLDVSVMRRDFRLSGCVSTELPVANVGQVTREDGTTINVTAWFFDEGGGGLNPS